MKMNKQNNITTLILSSLLVVALGISSCNEKPKKAPNAKSVAAAKPDEAGKAAKTAPANPAEPVDKEKAAVTIGQKKAGKVEAEKKVVEDLKVYTAPKVDKKKLEEIFVEMWCATQRGASDKELLEMHLKHGYPAIENWYDVWNMALKDTRWAKKIYDAAVAHCPDVAKKGEKKPDAEDGTPDPTKVEKTKKLDLKKPSPTVKSPADVAKKEVKATLEKTKPVVEKAAGQPGAAAKPTPVVEKAVKQPVETAKIEPTVAKVPEQEKAAKTGPVATEKAEAGKIPDAKKTEPK